MCGTSGFPMNNPGNGQFMTPMPNYSKHMHIPPPPPPNSSIHESNYLQVSVPLIFREDRRTFLTCFRVVSSQVPLLNFNTRRKCGTTTKKRTKLVNRNRILPRKSSANISSSASRSATLHDPFQHATVSTPAPPSPAQQSNHPKRSHQTEGHHRSLHGFAEAKREHPAQRIRRQTGDRRAAVRNENRSRSTPHRNQKSSAAKQPVHAGLPGGNRRRESLRQKR